MVKTLFFILALFIVLIPHYSITAQPSSSVIESRFLDVYVSSDRLSQADTLFIVVKNEPNTITGSLGKVRLRFFRDESDTHWHALVAMPNNKLPGDYILSIKSPNKIYQRIIKVSTRKFPITWFPTNNQLLTEGYTAKRVLSAVQNIENPAIGKVIGSITPTSYALKPYMYPLAEIKITGEAGEYGAIRKFNTYSISHLGADLKAESGAPVFAVNDGVIVFAKSLSDYGQTLIIDHGLGVDSLYLHLSEFNVKEGDFVKQGSTIALSGSTGYSTGPHLHFSMKVRMISVDPLKFISATQYSY